MKIIINSNKDLSEHYAYKPIMFGLLYSLTMIMLNNFWCEKKSINVMGTFILLFTYGYFYHLCDKMFYWMIQKVNHKQIKSLILFMRILLFANLIYIPQVICCY